SVRAYFKLQKPVSELVRYVEKLEYDIYEEIGMPATKVVVLSMHQSGASNSTDVVFGLLSDPISSPINPVSLSVLRSSLIELFLQQSNLTLTTSIFGQPSKFEILKFPKGITVIPVQPAFIWPITQMLFNFTLNNSIAEILANFIQLKDQLKYGLRLRPYENLFVQLTNQKGSTISSPVIIQASVTSSDFGNLLPQRLKQLAQTITESPAKNLGLNNSVFGKVKSISLSSYLKGTLHATAPTASPAPSPGPSISPHPSFRPTHPPASSPKSHHPQPCRKCKAASPSGNSPLHSPGPESGPYPSFPPLISPAPSTTAPPPCPYSRPATPRSHSNLTPHPHSTSQLSPDLPPLPSVSYGSRPGQGIDSVKGPVSAPLAQSPSVQSPSCKHLTLSDLYYSPERNIYMILLMYFVFEKRSPLYCRKLGIVVLSFLMFVKIHPSPIYPYFVNDALANCKDCFCDCCAFAAKAVSVLPKEFWLLGSLGVLIFRLLL
ncbi:hypothetical protein Goari_005953, partial [Gossypium aridum]|nr:hypothetical protein [Gossypium aridum]